MANCNEQIIPTTGEALAGQIKILCGATQKEIDALNANIKTLGDCSKQAEAARLTLESYTNEAIDTFVKEYTVDSDGLIKYTSTDKFSALHWAEKSQATSGVKRWVETQVTVANQAVLSWTNNVNSASIFKNGNLIVEGQDYTTVLTNITLTIPAVNGDEFTVIGEDAITGFEFDGLADVLGLILADTKTEYEKATAERMTSESYATEPIDTFVKTYATDGNGGYTATETTSRSALHWSSKMDLALSNVTVVENYANINLVNTNEATVLYVMGRETIGDGGEGIFYVNTTATTRYGVSMYGYTRTYVGKAKAEWFGITPPASTLKTMAYHKKDGISSNAEIVIPSTNSDYNAFAQMVQRTDGTILMIWGNQGTHNPAEAVDVMAQMSSDGGKTWVNRSLVYGDKTGAGNGTPYFYSLGLDKDERYISVFGIKQANGNYQPHVTTSLDGINWSTPKFLTIPNHPSVGSTYVNFGKIECLPDGTLIVAGYAGEKNDVCVLDIDGLTLTRTEVVDATGTPEEAKYSESVVLPLSQNTWLCFIRVALVDYPHTFVTNNAGTTWTKMPDISVANDAMMKTGWLPQVAKTFMHNSKKHILLGMGVRDSVSAPYANAPAVVFFRASVDELLAGSAYWEKVAETQLTNNLTDVDPDADSYHTIVMNDNDDVFVVAMDELIAWDTAMLVTSAFSAHDTLDVGSKNDIQLANLEMVADNGISLATATVRYRVSNGVIHAVATFTVADTTVDTGNIKIIGMPENFLLQEVQSTVSYFAQATTVDVGLKTIPGTGEIQMIDKNGLSNLTTLEIANGYRLYMSLTALIQ